MTNDEGSQKPKAESRRLKGEVQERMNLAVKQDQMALQIFHLFDLLMWPFGIHMLVHYGLLGIFGL